MGKKTSDSGEGGRTRRRRRRGSESDQARPDISYRRAAQTPKDLGRRATVIGDGENEGCRRSIERLADGVA